MRLFLIALLIATLPLFITAQGRTSERDDKTAQRRTLESDDKKVAEAIKIGKQAERLWKDDQYAEAEKLYYKSIEVFPVFAVIDEFARRKIKMGDIKGANKVWNDLATAFIKVGPEYYKASELRDNLSYVYYSMAGNNFESGYSNDAVTATVKYLELFKEMKPASGTHALLENACNVAFFNGDKQTLQQISAIVNTYDKSMTGDAKFGQFVSDVFLKILNEEYDAAEIKLNDVIKNKGGFTGSRDWAEFILPYVYFAKGDFVKAKESVAQAREGAPDIISKKIIDQVLSNFYGFLSLHDKEYQKAVDFFTTYLNKKGLFGAKLGEPAKFKYYTQRAESYEGLKDYAKARKDYEAALVYNADYEPAINGLARLEGRIITERKTDKAPPQITITEPAVTRGLIVKAVGNDVMIKGNAADPGGLKSVTINGEKVYSQEGGIFWGSIALKEGVNKVTVAATDFSGNTGEQVFDIERPASAVTLKAEPVKEGRNFALLIGCQNYDDNTIPSLDNPIADAIKLKLILKNNYNFSETNIITLFNPEQSDFKKQFLELNEEILPEDNLVIFYAGHGIWVEKEKKGYWMLTDAKLNDVNTWLPNKEVLNMIARLPARHTLLITDACFSGSVFKTRGLSTDIPLAVQQMNQKISRVAITSGNDTEVPDKSVFMKYLVKALSENKEKYLTAQKMFITQIIEAVMTETKTEPRYGTLELAGHVGGDFIFYKN